jgi:hypothetical protein
MSIIGVKVGQLVRRLDLEGRAITHRTIDDALRGN